MCLVKMSSTSIHACRGDNSSMSSQIYIGVNHRHYYLCVGHKFVEIQLADDEYPLIPNI